jgi:hypothetical protein
MKSNLYQQLRLEYKQALIKAKKEYQHAPKAFIEILKQKSSWYELTVIEVNTLILWLNLHSHKIETVDVLHGFAFLGKKYLPNTMKLDFEHLNPKYKPYK